jgi:DNA-binding IclR family transcriptional regulator
VVLATLIESGLVQQRADGRYEPARPALTRWALEHAGD